MPLQNTDQQQDDSGVQALMKTYQPGADAIPGVSEPSGGIDPIVQEYNKSINQQIDESTAAGNRAYAKGQTGINQQKQMLQKLQGMQAPQPPRLQNIPQAPKQDYADMFQAFQNPAVALAALGSLATRAPLTAAFKAGAAALDGFHQGNKQAMEQNYRNFKEQLDVALKQNDVEIERYKEVYDKYKGDMTKLLAEMHGAATIFKDEQTLEQLKQGNVEVTYGLQQKKAEFGIKAKEAAAKIEHEMGMAQFYRQGGRGGAGISNSMAQYDTLPPEQKETIDRLAERALIDPKTISQLPARNSAGVAFRQMVLARREQLAAERGMTPQQEVVKGQETAGASAGIQDFYKSTPSSAGGRLLAGNNALEHASEIEGLITALHNKDNQSINKYGNAIAEWSGRPAPTNFNEVKLILSDEAARYIVPGVGSQSDREQFQNILNRAGSPAQLREGLEILRRLFAKQFITYDKRWNTMTGSDDFADKFLNDEAQRVYKKYGKSEEKVPTRPATVPAGSAYSPGRKMWRSQDGRLFNENGDPVS